jgi:molybdopterin/thiamine biosynthesis adenylyltransferase
VPTERYSRNEALFGAEGQRKIARTRVAIIGLGGLGSHVAQQLAYLGVADYALVDFDVVADSSLNRLVGAIDADVTEETKKVAVAERTIKAVKPDAMVTTLDGKVDAVKAQPLIARADVVFGCLDRDLARLQLADVCARHAKPCFDLASDTGGEGDEMWYGGRVVFCDGTRCLVCLQLLDQEQMARDSMTRDQREADARIYGVERGALVGTGPMVVSINGAVASIAVTEFMVHVTGLRQPAGQLTYLADQQVPPVPRPSRGGLLLLQRPMGKRDDLTSGPEKDRLESPAHVLTSRNAT